MGEDRKATEEEIMFDRFVISFGVASLKAICDHVAKHPESKLKLLIRTFSSYEEFVKIQDEVLNDPVAKFEYDTIIEGILGMGLAEERSQYHG